MSALEHVLKVAGVNANICDVVMLNGYHLELFGYRANPGPALAKMEAEITLDEQEEEEVWSELLPSDDETPICLADVDEAFDKALSQKQETVLALKRAAARPGSTEMPPKDPAPPHVLWCTGAPSELEAAVDRNLREWQKLEWSLLRCEDEEMQNQPSLKHFVDFYATYAGISSVKDPKALEKQAFATFAEHTRNKTGLILKWHDAANALMKAAQRLHGSVACKHCQSCNRGLSAELRMDRDGFMLPKHRHGMFCGDACAKGRCKGCSFPLDGEKRCVRRCGAKVCGVVRRATWREYFEHYPKLDPEAAEWCRFKLMTFKQELLDAPMDVVTYGCHYELGPHSWL